MTRPQYPEYQSGNPAYLPAPATNALGVTAIIIGAVALPIALFPVCGLVAIPLSIVGLLLAFIGLLIPRYAKGSAIAGLIVCLLPILVQVGMIMLLGAASSRKGTQATFNQWSDKLEASTTPAVTTPRALSTQPPAIAPVSNQIPQTAPASSSLSARANNLEVTIKSAYIGRPKLSTISGDSQSKEALTVINLEITNRSETAKVNYTTPRGKDFAIGRDFSSLQDEFGNVYKRINFGQGDASDWGSGDQRFSIPRYSHT